MVFQPIADKTRWEGLLVSAWILLLDGLLVLWILQRPTDWLRFLLIVLIALSIPVLLHFLYRTWGAFTLEYWVDRNAITIRWANLRQIIPLQAVQQIIRGNEWNAYGQQWRYWPAPYVRSVRSTHPPLVLFATSPLQTCLLLKTGEKFFALSPADEAAFLDAVQARYRLGASQPLEAEQIQLSMLARFLGPGRIGPTLLGMGLLGVLILYGALMMQYPELPDLLPVRYTREGFPESVQGKEVLFRLPTIGFFAWGVNGVWGMVMVWRKEQFGAYLLWAGTIVVQIFLLIALLNVLP